MAKNTTKTKTPEIDFGQLAVSDDLDFAVFCQNLSARPKFGYGPIEAELDATGRVVAFSYAAPANDIGFEE